LQAVASSSKIVAKVVVKNHGDSDSGLTKKGKGLKYVDETESSPGKEND
jgi:hypothetical protein